MPEIFRNDFVSHCSYPVNSGLGSQCFALGFIVILLRVEESYNLPSHPEGSMVLVQCADAGLSHPGDGGTPWFGQDQGMALPVLGPLG